jgi:hypothetical protein
MLVMCVLGRLFISIAVIREKHKKDAQKNRFAKKWAGADLKQI